jgi:hypothetical protein
MGSQKMPHTPARCRSWFPIQKLKFNSEAVYNNIAVLAAAPYSELYSNQ